VAQTEYRQTYVPKGIKTGIMGSVPEIHPGAKESNMTLDLQQARADRDCLAAVAMAFAPATEVPRERALLRSAIHSLLNTFGSNSFRQSEAVDAIADHGRLPELRPHVVAPLFDRLQMAGIVRKLDEEDDPSFQLDRDFMDKTRDESSRVEGLIAKVVADLFSDISLTSDQKVMLTRDMLLVIAEVMERFGRQYAYQVAGRADGPISVDRRDFVGICKGVLARNNIAGVSPERMADAVAELFASREPHIALFVFSLTQNYFYMRLLGIAGGLAQLNQNRFEGAEFYLDTNIAIACLLQESRHHRSMIELQEVAQHMKVSLHISELTLEELKGVVDHHRSALAKTYDFVPDELVASTRNAFLRSYRERKLRDKDLTPERFLATFSDARQALDSGWHVTVMDEPVEKTVPPTDFSGTRKTLEEFSRQVRHISKKDHALDHDAHMYYVILSERSRYGDKAAWLLTLDTSLPQAAVVLQGPDAVPFAMTLDGFLQVMSPYVRSDHQQSFAEMYVELVGRNLFPPEEVIQLDDFLLFTDMDLTIQCLPAEDVKKVIRQVKRNLDGKSVSSADKQRVAYEVQKALADPTLKYRVALQQEITLQQKMLDELNEERRQEQRNREQGEERHRLELERTKREFGTQVADLKVSVHRLEDRANTSEVGLRAEAQRTARLKYALKIVIWGIILGLLAGLAWLVPQQWLSFVKAPLAFRCGICVSAVSAWTGILSKIKSVEVLAFVIVAIGTLFTVWAVLF
jgi:uncharacterized protein YbcI